MTWGAVATAAVSAVSSNQQAQAAKGAANEQARAAESAAAQTQAQFDVTQQQLAPYREAGVSALQQQQALLGLGFTPDTTAQQENISQIKQEIDALTRRGEHRQGLGFDISGITAEIGRQRTSLGEAEAALASAPQQGAQEQQRQAFAAFAESPGQQFLREQQERAVVRNASAIGGLGGGNVRTALQEQAFGRAQTDYANQFNRLGSISGAGQAATTQTGQFGAGSAANIANLQQAGGEARASGILGQQQAQSQGIESAFGALGQSGIFD